ncbi:MAG: hypothetical protein JNL82_37920 [Myxococcales bacterium]|nr:hypothetical protein [Myxococcales bacterium]
MRFVLPAELVEELRAHRATNRARIVARAREQRGWWARARLALMRGALRVAPRSIPLRARVAATEIVAGMDSLQLQVEDEFDAFLLDPGMGPMTYITADGRVLIDDRTWDGDSLRVAEADEATAALVVGAAKTGVSRLLELLPARPEGAGVCTLCEGTRWWTIPLGEGFEVVCHQCKGRGWTPA